MYRACVLILSVLLVACNSRTTLAPVVELKWQPHNSHQNTHIVKRGETLYAIAFRYDQDYRQLAAINHLRNPYSLAVGQVIRIRETSGFTSPGRSHFTEPKPRARPSSIRQRPTVQPYVRQQPSWPTVARGQNWMWPVNGRIASNFIPQQGKKGIDIAGKKGEKIHAASSGVVAYAGSGLSGYGNLIIIKHDGQYLTAYGNNARNMVREGQKVKVGQVIAEMGVIDRRFWGVHFEIRKAGKPVNPLNYLKRSE